MLVIIISSIVGVIVLGSLAVYIFYRRYQKSQEIAKMTVKNRPHLVDMNSYGSHMTVGHADHHENDEYQAQYHPKSDLGNIYGVGKGYSTKFNQADVSHNEEIESPTRLTKKARHEENGNSPNLDESSDIVDLELERMEQEDIGCDINSSNNHVRKESVPDSTPFAKLEQEVLNEWNQPSRKNKSSKYLDEEKGRKYF